MNLLVKVDSLLSNNIQLIDLILNDGLSLFESRVDFLDLVLYFSDLGLGFRYHLVAVLDLLGEMVC